MNETNCKNCGAVLSNGRYCQYCGADTGRTEHIVIKTAISAVPTRTVCAQIAVPINGGVDPVNFEEQVKKALYIQICDKIYEDIDSMDVKQDKYYDPITFEGVYQTKFAYAFL